MRRLAFILLLSAAALSAERRAGEVKIRILSTMLADDDGIGEWGFSALVEADGKQILFDTGAHPETAWNNARDLKIDLSRVTDVVLSHNHADHTGGLITLRQRLMAQNPKALSVAHVGQGIFLQRKGFMQRVQSEYEKTGGKFVVYDHPSEILPGVWLTGPVPRKYPERNWSGAGTIETPDGPREDNIPEDMSMVFDTDKGLVVLSGCGHSGIVNTLDYSRTVVRDAPVWAAIGGFHLYQLDDEKLAWTAQKLREFGLRNFLGAHCTGIEATYRIRQLTGLTRRSCAVGAVGGKFDLSQGIDPGNISK